MLKKVFGGLLVLAILFLSIINPVLSACQQPSVRSCNTECAHHLPSWPTFEYEACITACVADDQVDWAAYYQCVDDEADAQQAEWEAEQAALEEQRLAELEAQQQAELEAQQQAELETQQQAELEAQQQSELEAQQQAELEQQEKEFSADLIEGDVKVKQADGSWKQITTDDKLKEGDVIKTGDGTVDLYFFDGSVVTLGKNSEFTAGNIDSENTIFDLNFGRIWAWIQKLDQRKFSVRTPTVVHAVRGTEFMLEYDPDTRISTVHLYEGILDVTTSTGETIELNAGESISVENDLLTESSSMDEDEWYAFLDALYEDEVEVQGDAEPELYDDETLTSVPEENNSGSWSWANIILLIVAGVAVYLVKSKFKPKKKKKK